MCLKLSPETFSLIISLTTYPSAHLCTTSTLPHHFSRRLWAAATCHLSQAVLIPSDPGELDLPVTAESGEQLAHSRMHTQFARLANPFLD